MTYYASGLARPGLGPRLPALRVGLGAEAERRQSATVKCDRDRDLFAIEVGTRKSRISILDVSKAFLGLSKTLDLELFSRNLGLS